MTNGFSAPPGAHPQDGAPNGVRPHNIVLTGFMGAGKTTVGRLVAARLGWPFVDTDDLIEQAAGQRIAAIFADQGEPAFRTYERRACQQIAAQPKTVVATGAGALIDAEVRTGFLARGLVVCLTAPLAESIRRIGHDPARPLFSADRAHLRALYAARAPIYAALPHHVETAGRAPEALAEEIVTLWNNCTH